MIFDCRTKLEFLLTERFLIPVGETKKPAPKLAYKKKITKAKPNSRFRCSNYFQTNQGQFTKAFKKSGTNFERY